MHENGSAILGGAQVDDVGGVVLEEEKELGRE